MSKILVVDDDKISHAFIKRALFNLYDLSPVFSGEEALQKLDLELPDLILLDVEMPGMNGYAVCEEIKRNPDTADTPVIFLSARDELRDRMQGFEAGADDYMVKPFQPEALIAKIKVILQYKLERKALVKEVEDARRTAFIAIAGSSDLGQAIQFIENTHEVTSHEQLAKKLFQVTRNMGLNCTLMIKGNDEQCMYFSSSFSAVSPLEIGLINALESGSRFFDFGCRTQINYPRVAILVKNMPLDDMERYGRIKDVLPAMLSTADTKVNQINTLTALSEQLHEANQFINSTTHTLDEIKHLLHQQQKEGIRIMRKMLAELDRKLPSMALDEDQEQYILNRIDKAVEDAHHVISNNHKTNAYFGSVIHQLKDLLHKQQKIHEQLYRVDEPSTGGSDTGYEMDVELF